MTDSLLFAFGFGISALTAAGIFLAAIERFLHRSWESHEADRVALPVRSEKS